MAVRTFQEFLESKNEPQFDEGLGSWVGQKLGQGADLAAKGIGRLGNAAVSGLGAGMMQGAKRFGNVLMQGNAANQAEQWGLQAQKAAKSGDPQQFKAMAQSVYKQMKAAQGGGQPRANVPPTTGGGQGNVPAANRTRAAQPVTP